MQENRISKNSNTDSQQPSDIFILRGMDDFDQFTDENYHYRNVTEMANAVITKLITNIEKDIASPEYLRMRVKDFIEALRTVQHEWSNLDYKGRILSFDKLMNMIGELEAKMES